MSNSPFDRNVEETRLAEFVVQQVIGRAAGRIQNECLYNPPRDVYFIGNLRPKPSDPIELMSEPTALRELRSKLAPMAFGADFRVSLTGDAASVAVTVTWDCYYRVFPTRSQQREHQIRQTGSTAEGDSGQSPSQEEGSATPTVAAPTSSTPATETDQPAAAEDGEDPSLTEEQERETELAEAGSPETAETAQDRRRERRRKDTMFIRFRKISCRATGQVRLTYEGGEWRYDKSDLDRALDTETTRAQQVAMADSERVRCSSDPMAQITIPETSLNTDPEYAAFLQSLTTPIIPEWKWQTEVEIRSSETDDPSEQVLQLALINVSPFQAPSGATSPRRRDNPNIEPYLFDTHAAFEFEGIAVLPFELELAPRGFRYNRELWGRGFNCAVERNATSSRFWTTHTPIARQMRYTTRDNPRAEFAALARDPLPTLEAIATSMDSYLDSWRSQRAAYMSSDREWEAQFGSSFDQDQQQFESEIADFQRGLQLIRSNDDVRLAFQLTNETFRQVGDHPSLPASKLKDSWRLFQIVFLVSQIPNIAALADPNSPDATAREQVDIIYFPTGGGKTEAYLATLIFHCFYDRLRGKTAGVTAWTRFPLRLLTLQQTQRVADVIGVAELVRRGQPDARLSGRNVAGFAVGYFVGKEATPNEIINADEYQYATPENRTVWSQANDDRARQNWRRVITCPACRTRTVRVDFDVNAVRVDHRCTRSNCDFPNGRIPVYVVDNEIYRYLPSVIVLPIIKTKNRSI